MGILESRSLNLQFRVEQEFVIYLRRYDSTNKLSIQIFDAFTSHFRIRKVLVPAHLNNSKGIAIMYAPRFYEVKNSLVIIFSRRILRHIGSIRDLSWTYRKK